MVVGMFLLTASVVLLLAAGSRLVGGNPVGNGSLVHDEELQVPKFLGTWYGVAVATNNSELQALMQALSGSVYAVERGHGDTVVIHGASLLKQQCIREAKHFNLLLKEKILIPFVPENSTKSFSDFVGDTNATYTFLKLEYEHYSVMQQRGFRNGTAETILYLLGRKQSLVREIIGEFRDFADGIGLDGKAAVVVPNSDLCSIHGDPEVVKEKDSKEAKEGEDEGSKSHEHSHPAPTQAHGESGTHSPPLEAPAADAGATR